MLNLILFNDKKQKLPRDVLSWRFFSTMVRTYALFENFLTSTYSGNSIFQTTLGKKKLAKKIGVKLLYLTGEGKLSLVRIVENLEKPRSRNQDSPAHMQNVLLSSWKVTLLTQPSDFTSIQENEEDACNKWDNQKRSLSQTVQ